MRSGGTGEELLVWSRSVPVVVMIDSEEQYQIEDASLSQESQPQSIQFIRVLG